MKAAEAKTMASIRILSSRVWRQGVLEVQRLWGPEQRLIVVRRQQSVHT